MFCSNGTFWVCGFQLCLACFVLVTLFPLYLIQIRAEKIQERVGQIPYFVHRSCAFGTLCDIGTILILIASNTQIHEHVRFSFTLIGAIFFRLEFCVNIAFASYYLLMHLNWVKKVNDRTNSKLLLNIYRVYVISLICIEIGLTICAMVLNHTWPEGVRGCYEIVLLLSLWIGLCYTQTTMRKISRASHERVRTTRNSISRTNLEIEHVQTLRKINRTLLGVFCLLIGPIPIITLRAVNDFKNSEHWYISRGDYFSAFIDTTRVCGYCFALWYAWVPIRRPNAVDRTPQKEKSLYFTARIELPSLVSARSVSVRPSLSIPTLKNSDDNEHKRDISFNQLTPASNFQRIRIDTRLSDSLSGKIFEDSITSSSSPLTRVDTIFSPTCESPKGKDDLPSLLKPPPLFRERAPSVSVSISPNSGVPPLIGPLETVAEHQKRETSQRSGSPSVEDVPE